jgi:multicomponent Na+:H+ antiporter subunit E
MDQAILGNSITVTPGTLTLDVHDGVLKVHSLTREGAESLLSGDMDRWVAGLRRG